MAGSIQRFGTASNLMGLKLLLADKLQFGKYVLPSIGRSRSTAACLQNSNRRTSSNSYRLYSTSPASPAAECSASTGHEHFGATVGMLSNPSLYRLPLRAPPIINQRLIIDYKIPPRLPISQSEILDQPPVADKSIEAPNTPSSEIERRAKGRPGLVVIRRIKMNKHKLKKRRRKLKYLILKIKTRRETRKEKEFLNGLMAQIREADKFDAKTYVASVIAKAKEKPPVVMYWKGTRMPDWLVKEKLAEKAATERQDYLSILDKRDQGKLK